MSRRHEAMMIARMQDKIARAGLRVVRRELLRASRYAAERYELSGQILMPEDMRRRLWTAFSKIHERAISQSVQRTQRLLKSDAAWIEKKFDWPELAKRFVFEFAAAHMTKKITLVEMSLLNSITTVIKQGVMEGEGQDKIGARIRRVSPKLTKTQAARIARTEVHGASGFAGMKTAEIIGDDIILEREWMSVEDERTRTYSKGDKFDHREVDGQRRGFGEAFNVSGEALMYPGDPNGSAGNIINCRCAAVEVLKEIQ